MLFDTDILIWFFRGNEKAARTLEDCDQRHISVVSYLELLQGAKNKAEIKLIRGFLKDFGFVLLPLTENIGHRASVYMEEYCLRIQLCLADALIAATAVENNLTLLTGNSRHYKCIGELDLKIFRPE
jgi:predicted nucleic acid-binding protein